MTDKQYKKIEQIKKMIPRFDFYGAPEKYEVKKWEVEELGVNGIICVVLVTGLIGDEGTMASLLCRKHRQFFVGARGGISVMNRNYNFTNVSAFDLMNKYYTD